MSSKFDEEMLGVQFFLLSIKINEESILFPIFQKGAFQRSMGRELQNFCFPDPKRVLVSYTCFLMAYSFLYMRSIMHIEISL